MNFNFCLKLIKIAHCGAPIPPIFVPPLENFCWPNYVQSCALSFRPRSQLSKYTIFAISFIHSLFHSFINLKRGCVDCKLRSPISAMHHTVCNLDFFFTNGLFCFAWPVLCWYNTQVCSFIPCFVLEKSFGSNNFFKDVFAHMWINSW